MLVARCPLQMPYGRRQISATDIQNPVSSIQQRSSAANFAIRAGFRSRTLFLDDAATRIALAPQHGIDNRVGASHPGFDRNRSGGTILNAGPAFHAGIPVFDFYLSPIQAQDCMGTNLQAHPAARTFVLKDPQGGDVLQIDHAIHFPTPSLMGHR
jgi:hypothetical protein